LRDPEYRKAFVASQINMGLPFQLRALLKSRGKTQEWLAEKAGMLQPRISGLLNPGKTRPNIETLRRLAEAFDCGLAVRFVPFSELAGWSERFDPESFAVPEFDNDTGFQEPEAPKVATAAADAAGVPPFASGDPRAGASEPRLFLFPKKDLAREVTKSIREQNIAGGLPLAQEDINAARAS
jgi:transcriptional regulator with XRE-family HTH domain